MNKELLKKWKNDCYNYVHHHNGGSMKKKTKVRSKSQTKRIAAQKQLTCAQEIGIMEPNHKYGYTESTLRVILSKPEFEKFCNWISGQTCMRDEKTLEWVYYTYDVARFVRMVRHGGIDLWD